jgi:histidinol-phosphate aminotransferase
VILVLDEAYNEFSGHNTSMIQQVCHYNNLIVLRTFSKWAGLAGLRVGYGAFPSSLMPFLWKCKQPYNVSVAAAAAASIALDHQQELTHLGQKIIAERERLFALLAEITWLEPYPSQTNFILCKLLGKDALELKNQLAQAGILVRHFNKPGLQAHIRISVGTPQQSDILLNRLRSME